MRWLVAVLFVIAAPLVRAQGTQEIGSATVIPMQVTGDDDSRFVMVVLGDGYTQAEQAKFRQHLDRHLNILWSIEPFRSYRNYFNVYAVSIVSGESGIHCDPEVREPRTTPLMLQFGGGCTNINARGVTVRQGAQATVQEYARRATPEPDQILIIANSDTYGGIGGRLATTTGGNAISPLITPHELGHSLGGLTDEYTYSARGRAGDMYDRTEEPSSIHMTLLTEDEMRARQLKWWRWLGEPSESGGVIGRFEGGMGNTKGVWRPSKHSMMISLGYAFDQVSRERMTQRIAERTGMIAAAAPTDAPVGRRDTLWVTTAHPVYHRMDVAWSIGGRDVPAARNRPYLDLSSLELPPGEQTVTATVVDPTAYVRDPAIRTSALTATRTWTVRADVVPPAEPFVRRLAGSTQTDRPIGGTDVVYLDLTASATAAPMIMPPIIWRLDGEVVTDANGQMTFPLDVRQLSPGAHTLAVRVGDESRQWTVDNTMPTVAYTLSLPVATIAGDTPHVYMRDEFTMKLEPADDQPGYVVAEFRVNGDGWHHYYGWPDAPPGTPFKFTARGTNIKELIYGSLASEGLSPQPWEPREPGWGSHRVEYRGIDAAGNISSPRDFRVTVMPAQACTATVTGEHRGDVRATSGVTCINGANVTGSVIAGTGATVVATGARIAGGVRTTDASVVELVDTTVGGDVAIAGTTDRVVLFKSTVTGATSVTGSRGAAPSLVGNAFGGRLDCSGNGAVPVDGGTPNTMRNGAAGQCAAFGVSR